MRNTPAERGRQTKQSAATRRQFLFFHFRVIFSLHFMSSSSFSSFLLVSRQSRARDFKSHISAASTFVSHERRMNHIWALAPALLGQTNKQQASSVLRFELRCENSNPPPPLPVPSASARAHHPYGSRSSVEILREGEGTFHTCHREPSPVEKHVSRK